MFYFDFSLKVVTWTGVPVLKPKGILCFPAQKNPTGCGFRCSMANFRVERKIGRGQFSEVYRAVRLLDRQSVALKKVQVVSFQITQSSGMKTNNNNDLKPTFTVSHEADKWDWLLRLSLRQDRWWKHSLDVCLLCLQDTNVVLPNLIFHH